MSVLKLCKGYPVPIEFTRVFTKKENEHDFTAINLAYQLIQSTKAGSEVEVFCFFMDLKKLLNSMQGKSVYEDLKRSVYAL